MASIRFVATTCERWRVDNSSGSMADPLDPAVCERRWHQRADWYIGVPTISFNDALQYFHSLHNTDVRGEASFDSRISKPIPFLCHGACDCVDRTVGSVAPSGLRGR